MTILTLVVMAVLAAAPQNQDKAEVALKAAMDKEVLDGNLKAAIEQYRKIAVTYRGNRSVVARALLQLGQCYEKQGDAEARKAYDQLVREYGDQKEPVAAARARLAAMGGPASGPTTRLVVKGRWSEGPSLDGRFLLQSDADGLYLRDLGTGQVRHIAEQTVQSAAVSPDGRQVAFLRWTNDACQLRIVGADGSAERLLWQAAGKVSGAGLVHWFPDGKRIALIVWPENGVGGLMAVSATDGAVTMLREGGDFDSAQLSPDGKSVVYTKRVREKPAADELWLLRLEDRSEVLLFEAQSVVGFPLWTPDGAGVVFLNDRRAPGVTIDLWFLRIAAGKPLGFPELVKTGLGEMANALVTAAYPGGSYPAGPITRNGTYYFNRRTDGGMRQLLTTKFDPDTGKVVGTPSFVSRKGGYRRVRPSPWMAAGSHTFRRTYVW